jgi:hypothetical protein
MDGTALYEGNMFYFIRFKIFFIVSFYLNLAVAVIFIAQLNDRSLSFLDLVITRLKIIIYSILFN